MTMNTDQRRAVAAGMRHSAQDRRCERCGRHAAMVTRRSGNRQVYICRWALEDKCGDPGVGSWVR